VGMIIAGYEVPHTHIHLVPTNELSELSFAHAATHVEREELESAAEIIREELRRMGRSEVC
jgi:diadenosine tetraphosphate (Ap4A) HIT family hydrolase